MTASEPTPAVYELPLSSETRSPDIHKGVSAGAMPEKLLLQNVLWFCRFRWIVVGVLIIFGSTEFYPDLMADLRLRSPGTWPFVIAAILVVTNLAFVAHGRYLARAVDSRGVAANLWMQIISDLLVLTAVVHFMGSLETPVPFVYLFHIVLACIFFSRLASLIVTGVSCVLYVSCVLAEETGLVHAMGVYAGSVFHPAVSPLVLQVFLILAIWLVVWYLTSHLSAMVRRREADLTRANRLLTLAQEERMQHMLATTHQLKAPFAAIHANTQLLLKGHCGVLPAEASEVVNRIAARCRRLARDIQDMLQLANLESGSQDPMPRTPLSLVDVLRWSMAQVLPMAQERHISIQTRLEPAQVVASEDHLKVLFTNLLANAVSYSNVGGEVRVRCAAGAGGAAVAIEDDGIGILPDKLPRIFDEYYRTDEAVRHNRESSGLGLAIVRRVAQTYGIRIRVTSRAGAGTRFDLEFPRAIQPETDPMHKERQDGPSADY